MLACPPRADGLPRAVGSRRVRPRTRPFLPWIPAFAGMTRRAVSGSAPGSRRTRHQFVIPAKAGIHGGARRLRHVSPKKCSYFVLDIGERMHYTLPNVTPRPTGRRERIALTTAHPSRPGERKPWHPAIPDCRTGAAPHVGIAPAPRPGLAGCIEAGRLGAADAGRCPTDSDAETALLFVCFRLAFGRFSPCFFPVFSV